MLNKSNIVKQGGTLLYSYLFNKRVPINVILSVTNKCNSDCKYCKIADRQTKELTTQEIFNLIDQISEAGARRIGLWGGEPLLRDDICELINYAKSKNLFVTLDSNGYLLPGKLNDLKKIDHLILPLDGPEYIHDLVRGEGSYRKTLKALNLVKGKIPTWTITVLTKYNINHLNHILQKADELKFLTTFQILHHNDYLGKNFYNLLPSDDDYRKAILFLIHAKKNNAPIASSSQYLTYLLNWPNYRKRTSIDSINGLSCLAGRFFFNVDTNGDVYPCSLLIGEMSVKNYLDVGFQEAFRSINNIPCKSCTASCYIEYSFLYSLKFGVILDWLSSFRKTKKFIVN